MNVTLGTKLHDGRRVGIEWRCTKAEGGTVLRAVLTHTGDLSDDDLVLCLAEIGASERIAHAAERVSARRKRWRRSR
jgi:hypothetical protein